MDSETWFRRASHLHSWRILRTTEDTGAWLRIDVFHPDGFYMSVDEARAFAADLERAVNAGEVVVGGRAAEM